MSRFYEMLLKASSRDDIGYIGRIVNLITSVSGTVISSLSLAFSTLQLCIPC
jgi:hypothetical protein